MRVLRIFSVWFFVLFISASQFTIFAQATPEVVLKEKIGWTTDTISAGLIRYHFQTYYQKHGAFQNVNVLEVDYQNPDYNIIVNFSSPSDSLSSVAKKNNAIAGINGSYELDATFVRTNGVINSQVTLPSNHLRFWKHEGAFFYNPNAKEADIAFGTNNSYFSSPFPNILSGAPMLIDNFNPVGTTFIGDVTGVNLNSLEYEDYRRHQGVRHPRTAVALTEGGRLLLIVVDGRYTNFAGGMTAKELTEFLVRYFNPKSALNIDGGGSSTMYIKGSSESLTGVVNYPNDNGKQDHYGQRSVRTFILVTQEGEANQAFEGGSGTIADPYRIATAKHMQSMHHVAYGAAAIYYKLTADIDMDGEDWAPLNWADPYSKRIHFDGNGHVIKNLKVVDYPYASLFGVLCGTCKNLGVIDADISSTNGGGIIGGYAGKKGPTSAAETGIVSNCYTTGVVRGTDGVGGIFGNIGKPFGSAYSGVENCYSTAQVIAKNTSGNSRAGGIAGIIFDSGVIKNCYATGEILSSFSGAGGIAGWSDASLYGVVAMNNLVKNNSSGNIGRIAAIMGEVGGVQAQGINCWAEDGVILNNAGTVLSESQMKIGTVTVRGDSYDGVTKTAAFLGDPMNYFMELEWDFASENNVWAQTMSNGKPIFQWLYNRPDYQSIDGHGGISSVNLVQLESLVQLSVSPAHVQVSSPYIIESLDIYDTMGRLVNRFVEASSSYDLKITQPGMYIIRAKVENQIINKKFIVN